MTRPAPNRAQTMSELLAQYELFAALVAPLDSRGWTFSTRCAGWQVRDVAAHVVGQAVDVVSGAVGTRTADEQATALRDHPPRVLAEQLRGANEALRALASGLGDAAWSAPSPVRGLTLGQGIHALAHDAYVHADDIRAALDRPLDPGPGLYASLDFLLGALERDHLAATDPRIAKLLPITADEFTAATGIETREFVLAATGRLDPARLELPNCINIYR